MNEGCVPVVIADAEFLSPADPVHLFPQRAVGQVVEVKAPDEIAAARRVRVRSGHGAQPLAERDPVRSVDLMLPLVSEVHLSVHALSLRHPCDIIPFVAETKLKKPVNIS